ncbi:MAG: acyl carrier protein [Syntrophales bacterium]
MNIEEEIVAVIVEQLDVTREQCIPAASFINDLGADSLDLMELIMKMEERFGVSISDEELQNIRTIKNVIDFIKRTVAA